MKSEHQFSWRLPWGNWAHETLLAQLLAARYLYVYPGDLYKHGHNYKER